MPRDTEAEARRRALARLLLLIGSWGFFLVVLSYARLPFVPDSFLHIGRDLGIALLVAAILGRLVDSALKQDLVRNAVSAAIGYLLPDSLKAELNWLYDQKFVTEQTYTVRLEHKPQGKVVIFHGHYARVIRNNSGEKACPRISGGTDEWFHPVAESEVTKCGFTRNGKFTPMSASNNDVGIGYRNKDIELEPQESIQVDMAYSLVGPESGIEILTHCYPIENPVVVLDVPKTLMAKVTFSHRSVPENVETVESGHITRRLNGILLPFTDIRIYWYLASGVENRRKRLNQQV